MSTAAAAGAVPDRSGSAVPGDFADWLAERTDQQLLTLLAGRPDVSVPPPPDFEVLARRLGAAASVSRALERVDRFALELVEVLALLGRTATQEALASTCAVPMPTIVAALDRLRGLGLVWGDETVHLPRGVGDELGPHPLGLGRSAGELLRTELDQEERARLGVNLGVSPTGGGSALLPALVAFFDDAERLDELVASTDEPGRALLTQLEKGGPVGSTGGPVVVPDVAAASTAVARLLAHGLLMPAGGDLVELPREVALALRRLSGEGLALGDGGVALADRLHPDPPELPGPVLALDDVDDAAAVAAAEVLRGLEALLARWERSTPVLTRQGGLPVRELRATAKALDLPPDTVAVLAELARAADLLAISPGFDHEVVGTDQLDRWRARTTEQRWAAVAAAWLDLEAYPGLATTVRPKSGGPGPGGAAPGATPGANAGTAGPDGDADKPLPVFSWDLTRPGAVAGRREVLRVLADAPPGTVADGAAVSARMSWQGPRRSRSWWDAVISWTLSEAGLLGVTGRGALSGAGRALLTDGREAAAVALGRHLPAPVDHVLIQGDLTAIAPGPLAPALAREIEQVADVESAGTATVFRFSEGSVRRALDAGRSGGDVQALITRIARGPVPQSLTYLVDDVARRHGRLRVGTVSCYLRCDDPALLAEVIAARRTGPVGLRAVAPTVAVSAAPLEEVLAVLRSAGYAPASESPDGAVRIERVELERMPVPARRPVPSGGIPRDHLQATVLRLRRAQAAARAARSAGARRPTDAPPLRAPGEILTRLGQLVETGTPVQIGFVNLEGRSSTLVVHPLLLSGGYLTAYDEQSGERRTFPLSRISSVVELTGPAD